MADIKIEMGAEEQVSAAAKKAAAGLDTLDRALADVAEEAKKTTAATEKTMRAQESLSLAVTGVNQALEIGATVYSAASRAAQAFAGYVLEGAKSSISAEKAQRQLYAALGAGTERITAMTAALQRRTGADADVMNQQAAALASMGLTTDQIERAIPALRAYVDVTGKDATRAITGLGKAFEEGKADQFIERLSNFIPAADAATQTFGGSVERLTRNVGELQEELGSSVTESEKLRLGLEVLNDATIELTGSVEGLGPLLGDGIAKGLEVTAEAAAMAARGMREVLEPTGALGATLTQLIPNIAGARTLLTVFAADKTSTAASGLDTLADSLEKVSEQLGKVNDATLDAQRADLDATLAKWRAKIAANEERAEAEKAAKKEKANKAAAKAKIDDAKAINDAAASLDAAYRKQWEDGEKARNDFADWLAADKAKSEEDANKARDKRIRKWWDESQKIDAAQRKEAEDAKKEAVRLAEQEQQEILGVIGNVGAYASAGSSAMQAFAQGMNAESRSDRVKGILSGVLQVVGGILGGVFGGPAGIMAGAGAGGAVGGLFSSLPFRDGGPAQGYEIPKARGGAVVLGETDRDGRIVEAHSGEVILNRGGALHDPNARASSPGGGGHTTINVVALDPMTAVGVIARSVEPAQTQRMKSRQGAKWRREIARAARGPSSGGGR